MANSDQPLGYRFGSFVLDLEWGGLLAADGKEIPLRPKSFALLRLLVENAGRIMSHEAIMTALWPGLFVIENNVTQCIHDVRRALGSEAPQILQTLPRRGYRFIADVVALLHGDLPPRPIVVRDHGGSGFVSTGVGMPRECRIQDPGYKPGQPPNHALHAGIGKTNPAPSLITRAAPGGVDVRSQHLRLMQDDPKTLPEDLAGRSSAVAFDTGRPTPHDGVSARLRDIAHEIDLNTTLQGSIRGIIDRLVMDVQSINVRMGLQRQPERPDIGTVGSAGERNDFTYRMALTLLMKIIEGVNHRIDLSPSED